MIVARQSQGPETLFTAQTALVRALLRVLQHNQDDAVPHRSIFKRTFMCLQTLESCGHSTAARSHVSCKACPALHSLDVLASSTDSDTRTASVRKQSSSAMLDDCDDPTIVAISGAISYSVDAMGSTECQRGSST